jgi:hypothetical protein
MVNRPADLFRRVASLLKPGSQQRFLNVAVSDSVRPVAEIPVAEFIPEKSNDSVLSIAFRSVYADQFLFLTNRETAGHEAGGKCFRSRNRNDA